jgi:hypothetical protein
MAQCQVPSLFADHSLFEFTSQKFFIVGDPATAVIITSMLLVEDSLVEALSILLDLALFS